MSARQRASSTDEQARLMSFAENPARRPRTSFELAREIRVMKEQPIRKVCRLSSR